MVLIKRYNTYVTPWRGVEILHWRKGRKEIGRKLYSCPSRIGAEARFTMLVLLQEYCTPISYCVTPAVTEGADHQG